MGKPSAGGGVGIEYGKIRLYSSQDDMDKLYEKLETIMMKWGYPESEKFPTPEEPPENEQESDEVIDEDPEESKLEEQEEQLVEEAKFIPEAISQDPWLKIMKSRKQNEETNQPKEN